MRQRKNRVIVLAASSRTDYVLCDLKAWVDGLYGNDCMLVVPQCVVLHATVTMSFSRRSEWIAKDWIVGGARPIARSFINNDDGLTHSSRVIRQC